MKDSKTARKVLGFLFFRSAFTQRNITSIGLVILFVVIYKICGGKIDMVPNINTDANNFGGVGAISGDRHPGERVTKPDKIYDTRSNEVVDAAKVSNKGNADLTDDDKNAQNDPFEEIEKKLLDRKKR